MAKNIQVDNSVINIIGAGTKITGDIETSGDIRIDGGLKGNLITKGKVVIGTTGNIEGKIVCNNADVSGTIKGEIIIAEVLSLKSSAKIYGNIKTNKLAVEPNAIFTGTCDMGGESTYTPENKVKEDK